MENNLQPNTDKSLTKKDPLTTFVVDAINKVVHPPKKKPVGVEAIRNDADNFIAYEDMENAIGMKVIHRRRGDKERNQPNTIIKPKIENPDIETKKNPDNPSKPYELDFNKMYLPQQQRELNKYKTDNDKENNNTQNSRNVFNDFMRDVLIYLKIPNQEIFEGLGGNEAYDKKTGLSHEEVRYKAKKRLAEMKKLGMVSFDEGTEDQVLDNLFNLYNNNTGIGNIDKQKNTGFKDALGQQGTFYKTHPEINNNRDNYKDPGIIEKTRRTGEHIINKVTSPFKPKK